MPSYSQPETDLLFARAQELKAQGINPYPQDFRRTHSLFEINEDYAGVGCEYEGETVALSLCGRVMNICDCGEMILITVEDRDSHLQFALDAASIEREKIMSFRSHVYRGDYLGFDVDYIFREQGWVTARITQWYFLALCMLPLPRHIDDPEREYRQRYVHLASSIDARDRFVARSKILRFMRRFLEEEYEFLEVVTPILQPVHADGEIKFFTTHIDATNSDASLRVSAEPYLKRLMVGGLERVYEIFHSLHNETLGWQNSPESQVMQCCMMLADLDGMMRITEQLIVGMTQHLNATRIIPWKPMEQLLTTAQRREYIEADADVTLEPEVEFNLDDLMIDLVPPWSRRSVYELVQDMTGVDFSGIHHVGDAMDAARWAGVELQDAVRFSNVNDVLMETLKQVVGPFANSTHISD